MSTPKVVCSALAFICTFAASLIVAYIVISQFFDMYSCANFVATGLLAMLITFLLFQVVVFSMKRHRIGGMQNMYEAVTNALKEISNGNFDVFIDLDKYSPHFDIGETINKMANNLGSMETMRQDFISNVSHEMQSPLTSISGFAKLIKEDKLTQEERIKYAEIIESESRRLSSLSENLLKLSSLDSTKTQLNITTFRLDKQLEQIALILEPQWSAKDINIEADLQRYTVQGDSELLSQLWINIIFNAIKFTPSGGKITITLKSNSVSIADTGIGIADEDKMHIFERFYKVDKARDRSLGGSGLGLSIVKRIVELHEGQIIINSELNQGTEFEIFLPNMKPVQ